MVLTTLMLLAACKKEAKNESELVDTTQATQMYDSKESNTVIVNVDDIKLEGKNMQSNNVEISVKNYGKINLELKPESAPITVANFKRLVSEKFYDGLTFHRIIQGFMIQGGDPMGTGMGGSKERIKGEFASNGVDNKLSHTRGAISMARSSDPNSASSQFFICDADDDFLDGEYAVFGYVTSGIEIVDKIAADAKVVDNNGTVMKEDQPIIEYIKLK